jgi:hypothetical protein
MTRRLKNGSNSLMNEKRRFVGWCVKQFQGKKRCEQVQGASVL